MDEVVVDGLRIAYRRSGVGPPLLLFHGAFEDSRIWADELRTLSRRIDVIAWDAPGCGGSGEVPSGWSGTDWSAAAAGFITALELTTPALAGLSFGSVIALLLARDHAACVGRLVLIGGYAGWGGSLDADALAQRVAAPNDSRTRASFSPDGFSTRSLAATRSTQPASSPPSRS